MSKSCNLIYKDDWLENANFSSLLTKIVYFVIMALGGGLLYSEISTEVALKNCGVISSSLSIMLRSLQIISILMIAIPTFFFVLDSISAAKASPSIPYVLIGIFIMCILSLVVIGLTAGIQVEISKLKCSYTFNLLIWIPVAILSLLTIGLALYRYNSNSSFDIAKQKINWQNIRANAALIEEIGKNQANKCGIVVQEGDSIEAFQHYLEIRAREFRENTNAFSRLLQSPEKLPEDKIPNIVKMIHLLEQDIIAYQTAAKQGRVLKTGASIPINAQLNNESLYDTSGRLIRGIGNGLYNMASSVSSTFSGAR